MISDERLAELVKRYCDMNPEGGTYSALRELQARRARALGTEILEGHGFELEAERAPRTPLHRARALGLEILEHIRIKEGRFHMEAAGLRLLEGLIGEDRAALAAPAPGREELERKLRGLYEIGHAHGGRQPMEDAIADLLALWEAS